MSSEQVWPVAACAAAVVVALVALLVAVRSHARAARAEARAASVADRLAELEAPAADAARSVPGEPPASAYVITGVGGDAEVEAPAPPARPTARPIARPIDGRLFADIVARETVVKAASWTHGLRRALSPESRNRIRFEARQESRRAGRERRAEMKQALREFRARERDAVRGAVGEDVA